MGTRKQNETQIERDPSIRIDASCVVGILRRVYSNIDNRYPPPNVLAVARTIISGLTDEQIMQIAKGEATLVGNNAVGITFKEEV